MRKKADVAGVSLFFLACFQQADRSIFQGGSYWAGLHQSSRRRRKSQGRHRLKETSSI